MSAPDLSPAALRQLVDDLRDGHGMHEASRVLEAIAARDSARAPSLHPLALAYLEAEGAYWNGRRDGNDDIALWDAHVKAEQAWRLTGCAIWQTPPASPSTESAQANQDGEK